MRYDPYRGLRRQKVNALSFSCGNIRGTADRCALSVSVSQRIALKCLPLAFRLLYLGGYSTDSFNMSYLPLFLRLLVRLYLT